MPPEQEMTFVDDSPYIGGDVIDDTLSPEEQAVYDAEMKGVVDDASVVVVADDDEAPTPPVITEDDVTEVTGVTPAVTEEPPAATAQEQEQPPAITIPKARLDREILKRRELEARIVELEAGQRVAAVVQPDDAPVEIQVNSDDIVKALDIALDGKATEGAALIVAQIQNAVNSAVTQTREQMREEMSARVEQGVARAVGEATRVGTQETYDATVTQVEADYPVFNPDVPEFDADLFDSAVALMQSYTKRGDPAHVALAKAAKNIIALERPDLMKKETTTDDSAADAIAAAKQAATAAQRGKNAAAAASQPVRAGGQSAASENGKINLDTLTEEEFDALPESVLRELRGDLL